MPIYIPTGSPQISQIHADFPLENLVCSSAKIPVCRKAGALSAGERLLIQPSVALGMPILKARAKVGVLMGCGQGRWGFRIFLKGAYSSLAGQL
jgi:hypothetical protein